MVGDRHSPHAYGGPHSDDKTARLSAYLQAFSIALKGKGFTLAYIDAFAGSGDRTYTEPAMPLLGPEFAEDRLVTVPGSARLAVEVDPPLRYIAFVEKDPKRFSQLEALRAEHPDRKIECFAGDANEVVRQLCRSLPWRRRTPDSFGMRATMFLDPYGMEVDWETLEAVAATQAVDLWYLFPLSGLYRQAPHDPLAIDDVKRRNLNRILGTNRWENEWYGHDRGQMSLLDGADPAYRTANVDAIERWVRRRLQDLFKGAVLQPRRIYNAQNVPFASLFFAVSNPSRPAVKVASQIADYILKAGISSQMRPRN